MPFIFRSCYDIKLKKNNSFCKKTISFKYDVFRKHKLTSGLLYNSLDNNLVGDKYNCVYFVINRDKMKNKMWFTLNVSFEVFIKPMIPEKVKSICFIFVYFIRNNSFYFQIEHIVFLNMHKYVVLYLWPFLNVAEQWKTYLIITLRVILIESFI